MLVKDIKFFTLISLFALSLPGSAFSTEQWVEDSDLPRISSADLRSNFDNKVDILKQKSFMGKDHAIIKDFLKQDVVLEYLTRPYAPQNFGENGPIDCSPNELWLYDKLKDTALGVYRSKIASGSFYNKGTPFYETIFAPQIKSLSQKINIMPFQDVYHLRTSIDFLDLRNMLDPIYNYEAEPEMYKTTHPSPILLSPDVKELHASLILHILNSAHRVQTTIMVNSKQNNYFDFIKERFLMDGMSDVFLKMDTLNFIDESPNLSLPDLPFLRFSKGRGFPHNKFAVDRSSPFLDASHNIQTKEDDENCCIYTMQFCEGIAKMSENVEIMNQISSFSNRLAQNTLDTEAQQGLVNIFQEKLKQFLPEYYDENGRPHDPQTLKNFHMQKRWELSGQSFGHFLSS